MNPKIAAPRPNILRTLGLAWLAALLVGPASSASLPTLDLARFHGQVVVVDFWASWCKPCRQSIPWLNDLRARLGPRGLVIIGVNVDAERNAAERFLREVPIHFDVVFDTNGTLAGQFKLQAMPSSFVYGRDGRLVSVHRGFRESSLAEKEAEIQSLLSDGTT